VHAGSCVDVAVSGACSKNARFVDVSGVVGER
jgi:hypothetical protein